MLQIVSYNIEWPGAFEQEAALLLRELGDSVARIEHVGSTSVPGMAAKPVIDIQISVSSLDAANRSPIEQALARIGYTHIDLGDFDRVYPFFAKPYEWPSTHHVHLCRVGSREEAEHLAFRDYLRANEEAAKEYVRLKMQLAAQYHGRTMRSREDYSLAKSTFVRSVLLQVESRHSRHGTSDA